MRRSVAICAAIATFLVVSLGPAACVAAAEGAASQGGFGEAVASRAPIDDETAPSDRKLQAARAAGEIVLDGALDEAAWSQAPVAHNFIQNDPREGEPATFDTEVRVLCDDGALYFGVFAKDDDPGRILVNDIKKTSTPARTTVAASFSTRFTTAETATSSPSIPQAPSGTRRPRTRDGRTTRTGTASGTSPRESSRRAGTPRFEFHSAR